MTIAAPQITSLIALTLPSTSDSARKARFYTRVALTYHELGDYAEDAETVTSELVTNAIAHAGAAKFGLEIMHLEGTGSVLVVVTDPSPQPPVKRHPPGKTEGGRGLLIVDALSAAWGWRTLNPGKAVYAILARQA
jgi:anti-sigma regulatory factor (Ser/Thr protein kinase)